MKTPQDHLDPSASYDLRPIGLINRRQTASYCGCGPRPASGSAPFLPLPPLAPAVRISRPRARAVCPTGVGPRATPARRRAGTEVSLVRRPARLTIRAGREERTCPVAGPGNPVGLGVRASAGAAIRTLRVARD